jgi:hypothetical protein
MATTLLSNSKTVTGNAHELDLVAIPIAKVRKNRLVAHWLIDTLLMNESEDLALNKTKQTKRRLYWWM